MLERRLGWTGFAADVVTNVMCALTFVLEVQVSLVPSLFQFVRKLLHAFSSFLNTPTPRSSLGCAQAVTFPGLQCEHSIAHHLIDKNLFAAPAPAPAILLKRKMRSHQSHVGSTLTPLTFLRTPFSSYLLSTTVNFFLSMTRLSHCKNNGGGDRNHPSSLILPYFSISLHGETS